MTRLILFLFVLLMSFFSSKISAQTASQSYSLSGGIESDKATQVEINLFNTENKLEWVISLRGTKVTKLSKT